ETPAGIEAFYRGFASGQDQVMVVAGRLEKLYKVWDRRKGAARQEESKPGVEKGELLERVIGYLKKSVSSIIKLPTGQIDEHAPLEKYGIDSIMVMQLTRVLEKDFGSLPKTLFFEYQNLHTLAGYFIEQHQEQLPKILGIEEKPRQGMDKPVKQVPQRNRLIQKQTGGRNPRNGSALPVQEARSENEGMDIA
ncbi:acyl carrier protein, partial [Paenibacillus sp. GbtcB18]|uniref:acyl carrier protein n=1 Tax=Paenibacillus sp. GbtcB18 TaxID=2824763 RepID=UPI001C300B42